MKNTPEKVGKDELPPELRAFRLGLWRVVVERETPISFDIPWIKISVGQHWKQFKDFVRETHIITLFWDVYNLGPTLFWIVVLSNTLNGVESATSLYLSNNLLNLVSHFHSRIGWQPSQVHRRLNGESRAARQINPPFSLL